MRNLILFVFMAVMFASQSAAQSGRSSKQKWEVSLVAGVAKIGDETFITPSETGPNAVGVDFDSGISVAFRVTDNFRKNVGAELEYAFSSHGSTFSNLSPSLPTLGVDQSLHEFTYNGVFYPTDRRARIRPFLLGGAGATLFRASARDEGLAIGNQVDLRNRWTFSFDYGGGVKVQLERRWGIRVDVRNHVANVPDYGLPARSLVDETGFQSPALRPDGAFQNWSFGVGLFYILEDR